MDVCAPGQVYARQTMQEASVGDGGEGRTKNISPCLAFQAETVEDACPCGQCLPSYGLKEPVLLICDVFS